ncbi:hypothetical protein D9M72_491470 [compost metagenome]
MTKLNTPAPSTVQTPVVAEVKTGLSPELALAVSVGVVPKFCGPGLLKVMVWSVFPAHVTVACTVPPAGSLQA